MNAEDSGYYRKLNPDHFRWHSKFCKCAACTEWFEHGRKDEDR